MREREGKREIDANIIEAISPKKKSIRRFSPQSHTSSEEGQRRVPPKPGKEMRWLGGHEYQELPFNT